MIELLLDLLAILLAALLIAAGASLFWVFIYGGCDGF